LYALVVLRVGGVGGQRNADRQKGRAESHYLQRDGEAFADVLIGTAMNDRRAIALGDLCYRRGVRADLVTWLM
jgi:hypothetical protein